MLAEESIGHRRRQDDPDLAACMGGGGDGGVAMEVDGDNGGGGGLRDLPQLGHETEERILADLAKRVTVSKGALPSVCCYTV